MKASSLLTIAILSINLLLVSQASAITITWTGKVPSLSCTSNPISNQEKLQNIQKKCVNDFQVLSTEIKSSKKDKKMIAFNL